MNARPSRILTAALAASLTACAGILARVDIKLPDLPPVTIDTGKSPRENLRANAGPLLSWGFSELLSGKGIAVTAAE